MRLLGNKSFQHPVLSAIVSQPSERDYQNKEFQATPIVTVQEDGTPLIEINFALSETSLTNLIEKGKAVYATEIQCSATYFRKMVSSKEPRMRIELSKGDLHHETIISPYVVCSKDVNGHKSESLHPEYGGRSFNFAKGDVLALAEPEYVYWDLDVLKHVSSVFVIAASEHTKLGFMELSHENEKIEILLHPRDKEKLMSMRMNNRMKPFLLSSVYFVALVETLHLMATTSDEYEGRRWHNCIKYKLEAGEHNLVTSKCNSIAQQIFELPFGKLFDVALEGEK